MTTFHDPIFGTVATENYTYIRVCKLDESFALYAAQKPDTTFAGWMLANDREEHMLDTDRAAQILHLHSGEWAVKVPLDGLCCTYMSLHGFSLLQCFVDDLEVELDPTLESYFNLALIVLGRS